MSLIRELMISGNIDVDYLRRYTNALGSHPQTGREEDKHFIEMPMAIPKS